MICRALEIILIGTIDPDLFTDCSEGQGYLPQTGRAGGRDHLAH